MTGLAYFSLNVSPNLTLERVMEPYKVDLSLVAGTAGTFAVAYSPPRGDWLVCRLRRRRSDYLDWLWVASAATEDDARKLAYALYARDLACRAAQ